MRRATLVALPCIVDKNGNQDALPTVLLEAAACGLPAVATRVAGVPEIIRDGVTGRVVAPGDPEALADALESLLTSPRRRAPMGVAARPQNGVPPGPAPRSPGPGGPPSRDPTAAVSPASRRTPVRIALLCSDLGIPLGGVKGASVHLRSVAGSLLRMGHQVAAIVANA